MKWTGQQLQFRWSELINISSSNEMNWWTSPVQMKWTGQQLQFRWNEPVNISSSNEMNLWISPAQMKWTGQHLQFRWSELVNISSSNEMNRWTSPVQMNMNRSNNFSSVNWNGTVTYLPSPTASYRWHTHASTKGMNRFV